ncbi:hypothetical protein N7520_001607 [Penicillium odoratum]|uniref:uncharacterized protein n=1 Tax=Penicillium odoratum TaxID=1167516 RepID=UPI0025472B76|nr:uncharacterized protein N7520_001607 [Penicillium odoratum]KAJ5778361.1 hypothetical protein N7520_001607 [Penicillium odoratum]
MVGIRKVSRSAKHEDFRRRLERALSLSPSDSDSAQGSSSSADCDTTEIESLEENNFPSLQRETALVGSIPHDATEDWIQRENIGERQNIGGESPTADNRVMIAFQCISELDPRVKSIQSSLSTLADKTGTIRSDLDDIVQRLVAVEAAIETIASENQSTTEEND